LAFTALEKQRQRDGLRTHNVLPRHAKGIRQGLACWSVLKLHKNGITGKPRIIHELYANSASTPIIEGQTTELYRIEQGVAQGCPMSPTLFNVFIDDLLDDLQTQCHADGIPISSALDRLVGMAYADDLKTVSGTHAGLQNIINKSNATDLWRWTARYQESHRCQTRVVCARPNEPVDQDIPDVFMWVTHLFPAKQRGQALRLGSSQTTAHGRNRLQPLQTSTKCFTPG
jgi:hypothetical protein